MEFVMVIVFIVIVILISIARRGEQYSKESNNGQKEYEEAERALAKLDVSKFKLEKCKDSATFYDEIAPVVDTPRMEYSAPPENQPLINRSRSNLYAKTVLDLLVPPDKGCQICCEEDKLYLMDALRNDCFDCYELPGNMIDFKTVWLDAQNEKNETELTAFIMMICEKNSGARTLEVLAVPDPMLRLKKRFVEPVYSDMTSANTIAHVLLDEGGMPAKMILFDSESSIIEYRHLGESVKMGIELDDMILVDLNASSDQSFFMYNGENLERWVLSTYGINRVETRPIDSDIEKSSFSFTRATFPCSQKTVLMTGEKVIFADTGKSFDITDAKYCTTGKLVATSNALYHLGSGITKIIDRPLKPLLYANLYEDPESFWAVYMDDELKNAVYVLDVEKDSVRVSRFGDFNGYVGDATITMQSEELFIYTTMETLRINNLDLFEATETKVNPMEPDKPDIFEHSSSFGGLGM